MRNPVPCCLTGRPEAGSLQGTILFTVLAILAIVATLACTGGKIPAMPAALYLCTYGLYAVYEVLAAQEVVSPVCIGRVCI